ncbi:hypothetical protein PR202_gb29691 [Eleusine coracana subsp. coracana]|uniref:Endonuclease/exonuclease/phosphatase domain-containing protein n=1 Tax=Eleusine coracana subsp. coracana TaxID=191504 RepID=A0AAV5G031_ELECO|nr:hypothetical protein PR202_gb29691 [Eleusine coracana subsp. coracana]
MAHLSWNFRGSGGNLNNPIVNHLARLITSTKAQVIFVSETRTSKISQSQLVNRFSVTDSHVVPATGQSRGLWLMWNDEVDLNIISSSHHLILASTMCKPNNKLYNLVCIYGDPHHCRTTEIWEEVSHFAQNYPDTPTLCMGDLNNIMHVNENCGPATANTARIRIFCCLVKNCGFFDLGYNGSAYTWTNKRFATNSTFQRLDCCLVNAAWCTTFPRTTVFHLPMLYSDHAPILAILHSWTQKTRKPFRFENWWLLEGDFSTTAKISWHNSTTEPYNARTKSLTRDLKIWSKKKQPIHTLLENIELQIHQQQNLPPQQQNYTLQSTLQHNHQALLTKNSEYHKQQVKKLWATKGDKNIDFFHQAILKRARKNRINVIHDKQGNSIATPNDIALVFTNYF